MARAFCPECAGEVPVGEDGRCFLGHQVRGPEETPSGEARGPEAEVSARDEPSPAGPGVADEPAHETGGDAADDDDLGDDFDLDSLEAAVAELGLDLDDEVPEQEDELFGRFRDREEAPEFAPEEPISPEPAEGVEPSSAGPADLEVGDTDLDDARGEGVLDSPDEPALEPPTEDAGLEPAHDETEAALEPSAEDAGLEPAHEETEPVLEANAGDTAEAGDEPEFEPTEPAADEPAAVSPGEPETGPAQEETVDDVHVADIAGPEDDAVARDDEPVLDVSSDDDMSLEAAAAAVAAAMGEDESHVEVSHPEPEEAVEEPQGVAPAGEVTVVDLPGADAGPAETTDEVPAATGEDVPVEDEPSAEDVDEAGTEEVGEPAVAPAAETGEVAVSEADSEEAGAHEETPAAPAREADEDLDLDHFTARPKSKQGLLKRLFG